MALREAAHTTAPTTIKVDGEPRTRAEARAAARRSAPPAEPTGPTGPTGSAGQPASRAEAKARRAAESTDLPPLAAPVAPDRSGPALGTRPSLPAQLPTRASIKLAATGELALLEFHDDVVRGRRAARPQGTRRRAELQIGRLVSNRRVWGGALAIALIVMVPGASMMTAPTAAIADGPGSISSLLTPEQLSALDLATTAPADSTPAPAATTEATATATAKAKAAAGTTVRATTPAASRSRTVNPAGFSSALSGLPWASGLYMNGSSPANTAAFAAWRGRGVDVVVDWPRRANWDDIENPDWLLKAWSGTPYLKSFGVAPIPEDGSSSLAACAAGANNSHWTTFAQNLKNSGYADQIVIRLGWEFNGDWYAWKADHPEDFAGCWRQIVSTVRAITPELRWDWNVNAGPGKSLTDAAQAYPGDDYVDVIGIDAYDQYPGVTSEADWQVHYSGPYGLQHWADFAKAHGKPFSVPEWGVYPTRGSDGGGDNPVYVSKMLGFFRDNAANLAYEAYFNCAESYVQASIFGTVQNPKAAAEYQSILAG